MNQKKQDFKPYIPAEKVLPEFTATAIILGIVLAVVFGAANAYLGLRVGMTVTASIPSAVISMGVIRVLIHKDSILENNLVQTIGSCGSSVAAGAVFVLPALFMWTHEWGADKPGLLTIFLITMCGGVLGIAFMIPLRRSLIVEEHGVLPYPEGTACAEILLAGEEGGSKASLVFSGLGISALYKFITDGLKLFPSEVHYEFKSYAGGGMGVDVLPALVGVGYICGFRISMLMFAGSALPWLVLMPLIHMFGGDMIIAPGTEPISSMSSFDLWSNYIRYIGAGAVAAGGVFGLIRSLPLMIKTFGESVKRISFRTDPNAIRTERDLPIGAILFVSLAAFFIIWLTPALPVNFLGALIVILFGFLFSAVSSRLVGLIGSSNNPVSGMTIATLLFTTFLFKATGLVGREGMTSAIVVGTIVCSIVAVAGDTSQDLKTGYIVGATPIKQQVSELFGIFAAALAIGGIFYLLDSAWGFGSTQLPAPIATLMKMIVEGVMGGNLPWNLVLIGVCITIVIEILGISSLPFAVGAYLPIHVNAGVLAGGILSWIMQHRKKVSEKQKEEDYNRGILFTSGFIAGEGVVGVLLAAFAILTIGGKSIEDWIDISSIFSIGSIGALVAFGLLCVITLWVSITRKKKREQVSSDER